VFKKVLRTFLNTPYPYFMRRYDQKSENHRNSEVTMTTLSRNLTIFTLIALLLLVGCNTATPNPTADLGPAITQTFQAVATQVQLTLAAIPTPFPLPINNPALPTMTPLPVVTFTPAATGTPTLTATITPTPTNAVPIAHVNQNTYCRTGPGAYFRSVFIASVGDNLKIVSATTLNSYVIVEDPGAPGLTCWIWTQYVEIRGSLAGLPVVTPPPTPTPTSTPTPTPTSTVTLTPTKTP
jgi:hypothetical protein